MIRYAVVIALCILPFISCSEKKRTFIWNEEIKEITEQNLQAWIRKVPFQNEWNPTIGNEGKIVFTNTSQVFPFKGKYKNENDDLDRFIYPDRYFYEEAEVIYKDLEWGESFVHAQLLYEAEELFIQDFFSETGSVAFSGVDAIYESYTASMKETYCVGKTKSYKTALYWVKTNTAKDYLIGFYQKGQLVLEIAFPCRFENRAEGLSKLQKCSEALGLTIKEWTNSTPEDLEINSSPSSFWKDPYYGIYRKPFFPEVKVKVNTTSFLLYRRRFASEKGVDYLFVSEGEYGTSELTFTKEETVFTREEYDKNKKEYENWSVHNDTRKIWITGKEEIEGVAYVKAEMYLKNKEILYISYNYPLKDTAVEALLRDIVTHTKVRRL